MVPKVLQSTDAFAPVTIIETFDDLKNVLKAMLVTGIPELGGSLGWTEVFDDVDGWVIRDANTGNTRDWIFRSFMDAAYHMVDVRGCDTASSSTTGVNIFPAEAMRPVASTSHENSSPVISLFNNSDTPDYKISSWAIVATEKFVYLFTECTSSYRGQYLNDTNGWCVTTWGHFKAHGANVETAMVSGSGYSQYYSTLDYNLVMGTSETVAPRFIQRTPDADPGDGALDFYVDADKVAIRKAGAAAISIAANIDSRSGLPHLTSIDDPIITSVMWIEHNNVILGSLPGVKYINANALPPIGQGNISTLADGKNYMLVRAGGRSSANSGSAMLINLTDNWDA